MPDIPLWNRPYQQQIIMEWYEAYVNFIALDQPLRELHSVFQRNHQLVFSHNQEKLVYLRLPQQSKDEQVCLLTYQYCRSLSHLSLVKARVFFHYKKSQVLQHCLELQSVIESMPSMDIMTHDDCLRRHNIKAVIKEIFTTLHYLRLFATLNEQIQENVVNTANQYGLPYLLEDKSHDLSLMRRKTIFMQGHGKYTEQEIRQNNIQEVSDEQLYLSSFLNLNHESQNDQTSNQKIAQDALSPPDLSLYQQDWSLQEEVKLLNLVEERIRVLYSKLVFFDEYKTNRLDDLVSLSPKPTAKKTYLLVGLYCGMSLVAFLIIFVLLFFGLVHIDESSSCIGSFSFVFPLFRGIGLLILYMWGLAWNSFGFRQSRISYRRILEYGSHYSTHMAIMKRASFFTLLYFIMVLLYFIGTTANHSRPARDRVPVEYTPFVVWVVFLGYMFFPNREVLNRQGRKYFYRIIKEVVMSPCARVNFLITYFTDQSVSFVIPIKDMCYTLCFYTSDFSNGRPDQVAELCMNKNVIVTSVSTYLIALVPLLLRMAQCYQLARQGGNNFLGHTQMWNFCKFLVTILTATFSFIYLFKRDFFWYYVVSSIISTFSAYYWDLKHDWGFLEDNAKHRLLRNHLSFKQPWYYYIACVINLIFRLAWTLSISPLVISHLQSPFIAFLIGAMEILRRCTWNFFRIEKEHIINCRNYSATPDISKQLQNLREEQSVRLTTLSKTNEEQETLSYFMRSKESGIHEVEIIPPQISHKISQTDIGLLKCNYEQLVEKEKEQVEQYQNRFKAIKGQQSD